MSIGPGEVLDLRKKRWIRNVCWSSDDPRFIWEGWIRVWERWVHMSAGKCCVCGREGVRIIGGHIILGQGHAEYPGEAANDDSLEGSDRVFIAPLCDSCNGQGGPLKVSQDTKILQLCGYQRYGEIGSGAQITGRVDAADWNYLQNGLSSDASPYLRTTGSSNRSGLERFERTTGRNYFGCGRNAYEFYNPF